MSRAFNTTNKAVIVYCEGFYSKFSIALPVGNTTALTKLANVGGGCLKMSGIVPCQQH